MEREYRRNKEEKKTLYCNIADEKKKKKKFLFAKEKKELTRLCPIVERLQIQNQVWLKKMIGVVVIYLFIRRGLLLLFSNDMIKELKFRKI